jgi:hypothetical protein
LRDAEAIRQKLPSPNHNTTGAPPEIATAIAAVDRAGAAAGGGGGGVAAGGMGGLDSGAGRGASSDQWFRGQCSADAGHSWFRGQFAPDRAAGLPVAKAPRPALASLLAGVVAAPLPDTGVGSLGALEALLRERTLETCGTEAILQLAPISQTPGVVSSQTPGVMSTFPSTQHVMSMAPSTQQSPPPPVPTVSESSEEAVRPRKRRNLGLDTKLAQA